MAATKTKRQRIDVQLRHGFLTHRDAIWSAIREIGCDIEVGMIESKTLASQATIKTYLKGLTKAGYLVRTDQRSTGGKFNRYERARWKLVKDNGVESPRVTRDGKPVTQGQARENMWRTMRIIKEFNIRHLVIHASTEHIQIKDSDAKTYLKFLKKAGYIRVIRPGNKMRQTLYRFIDARYTGPLPPMVQNIKQVYDPNTRQVVWSQGGDA